MITVGIDCAGSREGTAIVEVRWQDGRGEATLVCAEADDADIERSLSRGDKIGVDVPLGWPDAFVEAVTLHHAGRCWTCEAETIAQRKDLQFRATDRAVHAITGRWPLSVSSDRIAAATMRIASLMSRLSGDGVPNRDGSGTVVEVYPAAALRRWGLPSRGYKGHRGRGERRTIISQLHDKLDGTVLLADQLDEHCANSDHVLDALVAALIARASAVGRCEPIPEAQLDRAKREVWCGSPCPLRTRCRCLSPGNRGPSTALACTSTLSFAPGRAILEGPY